MIQLIQLLGAEGPSNPVDPKLLPYITTIVVAGLSFFVLVKFVWPRIMQGLDDREQKILGEIESAEKAREEAEKAKADFQSALADARREAAEMVSQARADAKAAGDELKARNEAELGEMKRKAREEIESARADAVASIHAEGTMLATQIAGKILQREISGGDQQRLLEESLRELRAARSN
jgi:F-type H+-transporting ATPase subunit b